MIGMNLCHTNLLGKFGISFLKYSTYSFHIHGTVHLLLEILILYFSIRRTLTFHKIFRIVHVNAQYTLFWTFPNVNLISLSTRYSKHNSFDVSLWLNKLSLLPSRNVKYSFHGKHADISRTAHSLYDVTNTLKSGTVGLPVKNSKLPHHPVKFNIL